MSNKNDWLMEYIGGRPEPGAAVPGEASGSRVRCEQAWAIKHRKQANNYDSLLLGKVSLLG